MAGEGSGSLVNPDSLMIEDGTHRALCELFESGPDRHAFAPRNHVDSEVAMEIFVARANLKWYRTKLRAEIDVYKREILAKLIAKEEEKLEAAEHDARGSEWPAMVLASSDPARRLALFEIPIDQQERAKR
jgi:hypothetical protein